MNGVDKETYMNNTDPITQRALQWEMFNAIFEKMKEICDQPKICEEKFIPKKDIKWYRAIGIASIISLSLGLGYLGITELVKYIQTLRMFGV